MKEHLEKLQAREAEELPPLPSSFVVYLLRFATSARSLAETDWAYIRKTLQPWLDIVIEKFGRDEARNKIRGEYGEKLLGILMPSPKLRGSWWEVLGVSQQATEREVKAAYRELSKEWHPDTNKSSDATAIMQSINKAWEEFKHASLYGEARSRSRRS